MANPIQVADELIAKQLTGFVPLTNVIDPDLIGRLDRPVDMRDPGTLGDNWARIVIVPSSGQPEQYRSGEDADLVLEWEVNIFVAGKSAVRLRDLEYEIWRAYVQMGEFKDGGGSPLSNSDFSPFDWVGLTTTPWRYQLIGGDVLRSFMGVRLRLDVQRSSLTSTTAPTVLATSYLASGYPLTAIVLGAKPVNILRIEFSSKIAAVETINSGGVGGGLDFEATDGATGTEAVGFWYYATGGDRFLYLGLRTTGSTVAPPGSGAGTLDFSADEGDIVGANGSAVAAFTGLTIGDFPYLI